MKPIKSYLKFLIVFVIGFLVSGCGGGSQHQDSRGPTHSISGSTIGLDSGQHVALMDIYNKNNKLTLLKNGEFQFPQKIAKNSKYSIIALTQLANKTCSIKHGQGAGVNDDIKNIQVVCSKDSYSIMGAASGLSLGEKATIINNGDITDAVTVTSDEGFGLKNKVAFGGNHHVTDATTVTSDKGFVFKNKVAFGGNHNVTILTQPANKTCSIQNGQKAGVNANSNNIKVLCSNNGYSIGGTVTGLPSGDQITLTNNGDFDDAVIIVSPTESFTFEKQVALGGHYNVSIVTQPSGNEICSVNDGQGIANANVNNINIVCNQANYSIGGSVSGLLSGQQVTLINNGDINDAATLTSDGSFTFDNKVALNGHYNITVSSQPVNQVCSVTNGQSPQPVNSNVNNIKVVCSTDSYSVGGNVSGLLAGQQVTLMNNGDTNNAVTLTSNDSFTFQQNVAFDSSYNVTVLSQPANQKCFVEDGAGGEIKNNINNVKVVCSPETLLHSFGDAGDLSNGIQPQAALALGPNGNFYGTTNSGGIHQDGVVFTITPSGEMTILHHFGDNASDGSSPQSKLVLAPDGNFYGTTLYGGVSNNGTIFKLAPSTGELSILYSFAGYQPPPASIDGSQPSALVYIGENTFMGTSSAGGPNDSGSVFIFSTTGGIFEEVVNGFNINHPNNGAYPCAELVVDSLNNVGGTVHGTLYGTTPSIGANFHGTVFKITPQGELSTVYSFTGGQGGSNPKYALVNGDDGYFYGVTTSGGKFGSGTVFKITPSGEMTIIYNFGAKAGDGVKPAASLIKGADGNFYGVTEKGGDDDRGTVFKVTPTGTESVLYSFGNTPDGNTPGASLVFGPDGNLYGTTEFGGANDFGTVFKISR